MGMFDDIRYEAPCPMCGAPLTRWQSKDGGCCVQKLTPWELWEQKREGDIEIRFYDACGRCGTWVEVHVRSAKLDYTDEDFRQFHITHQMPDRRGPIKLRTETTGLERRC
jgi:hypothetical protein